MKYEDCILLGSDDNFDWVAPKNFNGAKLCAQNTEWDFAIDVGAWNQFNGQGHYCLILFVKSTGEKFYIDSNGLNDFVIFDTDNDVVCVDGKIKKDSFNDLKSIIPSVNSYIDVLSDIRAKQSELEYRENTKIRASYSLTESEMWSSLIL